MSNSKAKTKQLYTEIAIGDIVTIEYPVERPGGCPTFYDRDTTLLPGQEAIVVAVHSPNVRESKAYKDEAVVVDWGWDIMRDMHKYRTTIWYQDVVLVRKGGRDNADDTN